MKKIKLEFKNIAGYEDIKNELNEMYSWFMNKNIIDDKRVKLPRGIIFWGPIGCGKTLFVREFAKATNAPCFEIKGKDEDITDEVIKQFELARKEDFAIVLIDEIDLLISNDSLALRALQTELDGLKDNGRVLVLATTNNIARLTEALQRPGRFDRRIHVDYPSREVVKEVYLTYLNKFNFNDKAFDLDEIIDGVNICCKAERIVNDAYLLSNGKINADSLKAAYRRLINNDYSTTNPIVYRDRRVAIHECGHAIMALAYKEEFKLLSVKFTERGGYTNVVDINKRYTWTYNYMLGRLRVNLAGLMAERLIFKKQETGFLKDMHEIHNYANQLISPYCYESLYDYTPTSREQIVQRIDTFKHARILEKKKYSLIKKESKYVYKYLKRHKQDLLNLANELYGKGEITFNQ